MSVMAWDGVLGWRGRAVLLPLKVHVQGPEAIWLGTVPPPEEASSA